MCLLSLKTDKDINEVNNVNTLIKNDNIQEVNEEIDVENENNEIEPDFEEDNDEIEPDFKDDNNDIEPDFEPDLEEEIETNKETAIIGKIISRNSGCYYEKINVSKLLYIYENPADFESLILKEEKDYRRSSNYNVWASIKKIIDEIVIPKDYIGTDIGYIKTHYIFGKNSNNTGRLYCKDSIGLQSMTGCIRSTVCDGLWTDIDQINSHPTIFNTLLKRNGLVSPMINDYIGNREEFLVSIGGDRNEAKTKIISIINGGGVPCKNPILLKLKKEIEPLIDTIVKKPIYKPMLAFVLETYKSSTKTHNINGKVMSRILQDVESACLNHYIDFCNSLGLLYDDNFKNDKCVSLIFDGFQISTDYKITDKLLLELQEYAFEKTGYNIQLKVKPFDTSLPIPENYKELKKNTDLPIINHTEMERLIDDTLGVKQASHFNIASVIAFAYKDRIVFDANDDCFFVINSKNIWEKQSKFHQFHLICAKVIAPLYKKYCDKLKDIPFDINSSKETNAKINSCISCISFLNDVSFVKNILIALKSLTEIKDFSSKVIDAKTHLFAFYDKVFDFKEKKYRDIEANDYIMTTCEYNFPTDINPEDTKFLNDYFKCIFPNEDKLNFVLDSTCKTLNADSNEQYFNIHTGSGSNSKTTFNNLFASAIGGYGVEMSPETFTKPKKGSNDTSELYKAKGKRAIFSSEPESTDDKLQTPILKRIADESGRTITARELYKNPVEFVILFILNFFCNNKPELSSVDGGIARRIRVIEWEIVFVKHPNPENQLEKLRDPDFIQKMRDEGIKNAFIIMLIDRWINRVSLVKEIFVPQIIIDAGKEYIEDSNPVIGYFQENYVITNDPKDRVSFKEAYTKFKGDFGNTLSSKRFKDDVLSISGVQRIKEHNGWSYSCIKLNNEEELRED